MLRWFVAITPMAGAVVFPLLVPIAIVRFGLNIGLISALLLSCVWFVLMLRTSEMPH